MRKSFNLSALRMRLPGARRDPKTITRAVIGVLLAANLAAAFLVFRPIGGSPEEVEQQLRALTAQVQQKRAALTRMNVVASKVEKGRAEGNGFLNTFFLSERTAYLTVLEELNRVVKESKIKVKEHTFSSEPIEGSSDMSMLTINGNLEGTYADVMDFVNKLDRTKYLIILESLQVQPQQTQGVLNVNVKLNTFVREAKQL